MATSSSAPQPASYSPDNEPDADRPPCPRANWTLQVIVESDESQWPERVRLSLTGTPSNRAQMVAMSSVRSEPCQFTGTDTAQYTITPAAAKWTMVAAQQVALEPGDQQTVTVHIHRPTTWVVIRMIDMEGKPVPGIRFRLKLPDGTVEEGTLDGNGMRRRDGLEPASCSVCFPDLDQDAWEQLN